MTVAEAATRLGVALEASEMMADIDTTDYYRKLQSKQSATRTDGGEL